MKRFFGRKSKLGFWVSGFVTSQFCQACAAKQPCHNCSWVWNMIQCSSSASSNRGRSLEGLSASLPFALLLLRLLAFLLGFTAALLRVVLLLLLQIRLWFRLFLVSVLDVATTSGLQRRLRVAARCTGLFFLRLVDEALVACGALDITACVARLWLVKLRSLVVKLDALGCKIDGAATVGA